MNSAAKFLSSIQRLSLGNMINEVKLRGGNILYSSTGMPESVELEFLDGSKFKALCYFLEHQAWFEGFVVGKTTLLKTSSKYAVESTVNGGYK